MKNITIKIALFINYFVFAMLLNSVGAVILQVQRNFNIAKDQASYLEGFKDIPIAIASFILASFLPKIGLKNSMLIGLFLVSIICGVLPMVGEFWYFKLLFCVIGVSFALIKVSTFATIGLVTKGDKEHASFMGFLEAFFMAGILFGNLLLSWFIDDTNPKSEYWMKAYWILSAISILAFIILLFSKLDESEAKIQSRSLGGDFIDMLKIAIKPLVIIFVISTFFYVLLEQSFQTWFPTFYESILKTPSSMAVQAGAVLAGAFMLGRLIAGGILTQIKWIYFLSFCLIIVAIIVFVALPLAKNTPTHSDIITWFNAPFVVYLMPILGLFLAPIYPTINSTILSALPKYQHSAMSGLIVVFSALGGTTGSMITGHIFQSYNGTTAFYFSLIPIIIIFILIWIFYFMIVKIKRNATQYS